METLLCTINLSPNTISDDRFSIGLIMAKGETLFFNYSEEKLQKLKSLFSPNAFLVIHQYLKSLYNQFNTEEDTLFSKKELLHQWVNEAYLSYLEKYNNNLVRFSKTTKIDIELDEAIFKRFFERYISPYPTKIEKKKVVNITEKERAKQFFEKAQGRVNIEKEIHPTEIEHLLVKTKVSFIGKNSIPVAGNMLNLQNGIQSIENTISRFISLAQALDYNTDTKGKYYLIGEEPNKLFKENHLLWKELRALKTMKYIELDEVSQVENYFEQHEVRPYFV